MALVLGAQQASSSFNTYCSSRCSYDVFLSFCGEDTRLTFTDHLYTAFKYASFRTFRDENDLERGEGIKPELEKAIQQSLSSVIVFSKNYASSKWCLNELVMIIKRKKTSDHVVLPVFYDVDPSHVRNQTGSLAKAFARHQKTQSCDKVKEWREALKEAADLAGMVLQNEADGHESKFITKIVKVIEDKLRRTTSSVHPYLIGIHSRAKSINLWLQDRSNDVSILVIHGMRGIGKTTIAKFVYDSNFRRFQRSSFVENIREISEQSNGLVQIQKQLLHDFSNGRKVKIHSIREGMTRIQDAISCKKVLLVLDDVDHNNQLFDIVFGMRDQFYPGSKIIITTSHAALLNAYAYHQVKFHCVETWNYVESFKLFSLHAFGQDHPLECYMEHSRSLVQHCEGLPLALKILGSSLSGKDISVWESAVRKLEAIPDGQILKKLKLSYDSLQDNHDRELFLHIACFFIGMDKDDFISILDDHCDCFPAVGLQNLIDRYLIRIGKHKKIQMHHMIRDMGREIVRLESQEPGQRSRLWRCKDSSEVLKENSGTKKIEGLCLVNTKMAPSRNSAGQLVFETNAFSRMRRLKFLKLGHVKLKGSYKEFPTGLRWLHWLQFPSDCLPNDFPLESLVALEMCYSSLRRVWKGTEYLPSLKILNLSHSHGLEVTPDFWPVPNLERLILKDCANLVDVHESIGTLKRLVCLNMEDCKILKELPKNIYMLTSLEILIISGCSEIKVFPTGISKLKSLKVLQAERISIHQLIEGWTVWPRKSIGISWASYLPHSLVDLSLKYCNLSDENFPRDFGNLPSLEILDLSGNSVCSLPDCIRGVRGLRKLCFDECKRLKTLLRLPSVGELELWKCESLERITFQSLSDSRICAAMSFNFKLVEVEYWFKLERIEIVDVEMINLLGLSNLNLNETITMNIISPFQYGRSMTHSLQGLYEYGIFSTFLPGHYEIPQYGSFSHKSRGSSISFTVPSLPTLRIRGLNFFIVYAKSNNNGSPEINAHNDNDFPEINAHNDVPHPVIMKVSNKSKVLKWIYGPTFICVPDDGQDVIWLSHWKFGNKLEGGDEVTFSVFTKSELQIKEWGIKLVCYEEEDDMSTQHNTTELFYPCVIAGDLSCNLLSGTYVLCPLKDIDIGDVLTSAWFNCVTGDVDEITDKEEEQGDCILAAQRGSNDNTNSRGGRGWKVVMMIMVTVCVLSIPLLLEFWL